ncbi:hypothetical protein [Oceanobacillus sp. FSL W7-1293]|uniref:nucleoside-diphosphate sugar epimerase/dehydratase n=1 Tax=Oceanobacillus sp. FSL W7-1293 TaxID=2921699 RepID=UPI0030D22F29
MKNKVILFGTGSSSERIRSLINMEKNKIIGYVDNNLEKQEKCLFGKPIWNPSVLTEMKFDYVIICSIYFTEIYNQLMTMRIETSKIINIYPYIRYNDVKLRLSEINEDLDTIITGMSYARYGFDNDLLNVQSINLAFNSQDLFYDYCLAKYILEHRVINIKYALISLSYFSFHFDLSQSKEKHLVTRYSIIKDIQEQVNYQKYNKLIRPNEEHMPYQNFELLNHIFVERFQEKFDSLEQDSKDNIEIHKERENLAKVHSRKDYPKTVDENKNYLHDYLQLLLEKGVKPIFVIHPQANAYRKYFHPQMINAFKSIINDFTSIYDIEKVDLFSSSEFTNDDFFDVHHLNSKGAKKVSKIINKYIE